MPEYFVKGAVIVNDGKAYKSGHKVTLSKETADAMADKLVPVDVVIKPIAELNAKDLRSLAKDAGIEKSSSKTKEELQKELGAIKNTVASDVVVSEDESTTG